MITATSAGFEPATRRPDRWTGRLPWWAVALLLFAASRIATTGLFLWMQQIATPASRAGAHPALLDLLSAWDGQWYWLIAERGYPSVLPLTASGTVDTNQWAFLPLYPFLAKGLTLGVLDWRLAAATLSVTAGAGTAVLLAALLRPRIGISAALFAVAVFSISPLAFVLQTTYAESLGLFLLLAALLLVDRGFYLRAVPIAVLLAFTRPGVLALALTVAAHALIDFLRARRRGVDSCGLLLRGWSLAAVSTVAGFAWPWIAAVATGRADAYFATESAWRALWMPDDPSIHLFRSWLFAANYWTTLLLGADTARIAAPVLLVLLVACFAGLLLTPPVRRLGPTVRLWAASWALYLLAVFFPQSSVFRLLMPMAPLAGALTPSGRGARVAVLSGCFGLQTLWLWVTYGPFQTYWSIP